MLKEEQRQPVLGLLEQKDVVAVLPTGFGKTFIYQLFAAVKLIEKKRGISCIAITRYSQLFLRRTPLGPVLSVHLGEMSVS